LKIAVFTNCQPRHVTLIERLAAIADEVYACTEVDSLFPLEGFQSEIMRRYFSKVIAAERDEFGEPRYLPSNIKTLPMKSGDLNALDLAFFDSIKDADVAVVFGASYIKKPLIDLLIDRQALNLHMGTSPYYRGSACNFWAAYDEAPDYVGATIHLLSQGLDSGPILCHAFPTYVDADTPDYFALGMRAVSDGIDTMVSLIASGQWKDLERIPQDKTNEIRYTRSRDFRDEIAAEFLDNPLTVQYIQSSLKNRDLDKFILPEISGLRSRNNQGA